MLVLNRKPNEVILIGDKIELKVLRINGNRVRVGITASPEIRVQRAEVRERVENGSIPVLS
jgi:carbon storage regulator